MTPGLQLGPYEIVKPIGSGGMGKVYEGRDPRLGRKVAIKIVAGEFSDRFIREARAVAALNHPHICTHPGSQKILSRWKRTSNAGG